MRETVLGNDQNKMKISFAKHVRDHSCFFSGIKADDRKQKGIIYSPIFDKL